MVTGIIGLDKQHVAKGIALCKKMAEMRAVKKLLASKSILILADLVLCRHGQN